MQVMTKLKILLALVMLLVLAACGGHDDRVVVSGPGFVGIDDRPDVALTAPLLTIEYTLPGQPETIVDSILSDQPTDGDIAFDPVLDSFTITEGPDTLLFGVDSFTRNRLEYRAFLDFPLDGSTGDPIIPLDATIQAAELSIFVDFVDFASTVPVLLDLVTYDVIGGLVPADYFALPVTPEAFLFFDLFNFDTVEFVTINVTSLMREAQAQGLADFQVRFLLDR